MHHDGLPIDVERAGGALLTDLRRPDIVHRHSEAAGRCLHENRAANGGRKVCQSCGSPADVGAIRNPFNGRFYALCGGCRAYIRGTGPAPIERRAPTMTIAERREKQREVARLYGDAPAPSTGPYAVRVNPGIQPTPSRRVLLRRLGYPC
jgi:hypothetical protein